MNKILSLICCLCVCAASALAGDKNVKIKVVTPGTLTELLKGYADNEIKGLSVTGTLNANDVQSLQRFAGRNNSEKKHEGGLLEVLNLGKTTLTDMESGLNLAEVIEGSTTLRKVMLGNVFYVSAHTFSALPNLESVDFVGNVGHIDGFVFNNLPKLSRITFHQSVLSTGGAQFVKNCPVLTSVVFKGPILTTYYGQPIECPQLKGYTLKAPVLQSNFAAFFPQTTDAKSVSSAKPISLTSDFFVDSPGTIVNLLFDMAKKTGNAPMTKQLEAVSKKFQEAAAARPKKETKLEILKQSAPYKRTGQTMPAFTYASGDDLSRIKRLLYWLHDLVRHDGSSSWPKCRYNCVDLYQLCQTEKRGLNCRFMAEMLCEALLAENIPARYITCQCDGRKRPLAASGRGARTPAGWKETHSQRRCQLEPRKQTDCGRLPGRIYGQEPLHLSIEPPFEERSRIARPHPEIGKHHARSGRIQIQMGANNQRRRIFLASTAKRTG